MIFQLFSTPSHTAGLFRLSSRMDEITLSGINFARVIIARPFIVVEKKPYATSQNLTRVSRELMIIAAGGENKVVCGFEAPGKLSHTSLQVTLGDAISGGKISGRVLAVEVRGRCDDLSVFRWLFRWWRNVILSERKNN